MIDYSVVIPLHNSEKFIQQAFFVINDIFKSSGKSFEMIFVDDQSSDQSVNKVMLLQQQCNARIRLLRMNGNHGQYRATICGILHAAGNYILTLDADVPLTSSAIRFLTSALEDHDELVYADIEYANRGLFRQVGSKIFNEIIRRAVNSDTDIYGHSGSSFRIIRRDFAFEILKNMKYPLLLDVTLMNHVKTKIKFVSVHSMVNNYSSYSTFTLLKLGLSLLFSLLASRISPAVKKDAKYCVEISNE